jgi:hypothetical protein
LLSAIKTCKEYKEYKNILLGYPIIVSTDHKINIFNGLKASDFILCTCWILLLEEYGETFEYLPGKVQKNVGTVLNALSRHEIQSLKIQEEKEEVFTFLSGSRKQQHQ